MNFMQRNASVPGSKSHAEVQRAIEEENAKREAALLATRDRSGASTREDAETRWELSIIRKAPQASVRVVTVGYGDLVGEGGYGGDDDEKEEEKGTGGRMKFGKYGVKVEDTPKKPDQEISDDSSSSSSSDDSDSDSSTDRQEKKAKARKRDSDEKILKKLHSISGSGPPSTSGPVGGGGKCFECGKPGHVRAACPELGMQRKRYTDNINRGNPSKRGRFSR
jgi:hypothetical protein